MRARLRRSDETEMGVLCCSLSSLASVACVRSLASDDLRVLRTARRCTARREATTACGGGRRVLWCLVAIWMARRKEDVGKNEALLSILDNAFFDPQTITLVSKVA